MVIAHLNSDAKPNCAKALIEFKSLHPKFDMYCQTLPSGYRTALEDAMMEVRHKEAKEKAGESKKKSKSDRKKSKKKKGKKKKPKKKEELSIDFSSFG
mmetsp:Transcript_23231/g.41092  ORF Transcript_23231/g.41092 Transcript_23231/m.41092 type:complete len:98 (-) Transcript_23231:189-482(-)